MTNDAFVREHIAEHGFPDSVLEVARQHAPGLGTTVKALESAFHRARRKLPAETWAHADETYTFDLATRSLTVPAATVAQWVRWYVSAGDNQRLSDITRRAVLAGVDITYAEMRRALRLMEVYKSSMPFAPHELEQRHVDDMASELREAAEARLEQRYRDGEAGRWKSKWLKERRGNVDLEILVDAVLESGHFPEIPAPNPRLSEATTTIMLLTDWHVGYRTEILRGRVEQVSSHHADIVCVGGDMLDGPQGNMRGHQLHEQDLHFEEQVLEAITLLAYAVNRIGARQVYAVTGNHDRTSPDRKDDPRRLVGRLVYHAASKLTPQAEWTIAPQDVCAFDVETTRVILTHGDQAKPRDLVWAHRTDQPYHLLLHGHLHHVSVKEDADTLVVGGGSLVGRGEAAERLGRWASPSQMMLEVGPLGPGVRKIIKTA